MIRDVAEPTAFVKFAAARLSLDETQLPDPTRVNDAGNTLGAICVRLGLLQIMQIEDILEFQREHRQLRFGEIAIRQGYMSEEHLQRVLAIQAFYRAFEIGTLLVLDGHLSLDRLTVLWTDFIGASAPPAGPSPQG
jgi:hypothetical protein